MTPDVPAICADIGARPDERQRFEIPEHGWLTCRGCPALRVFDWHYFYCRHLGDQSKPDEWNAGWKRIGTITWKSIDEVPCHLLKEQQP